MLSEFFMAVGEIIGAASFGYYYHKKGIKYTVFIGTALVAIFGTMIAYGLNYIILYYISAMFVGMINLGG